jgi:hypothetical protein
VAQRLTEILQQRGLDIADGVEASTRCGLIRFAPA